MNPLSHTAKTDQALESTERILTVATRLFADHGYHGVSTRQLAKAADLNVATVNYHVGSKRDLYREVFRRSFEREQQLLAAAIAHIDDTIVGDPIAFRDALKQLVDSLVQMTIDYPEIPRLWVRRWLEKPDDFEQLEAEFSLPLFEMVRTIIEKARTAGTLRPDGPRLRLFLTSFSWMLYGYFLRGPIDWETTLADPTDPDQLTAFKTFLYDYLCRMLDLPTEDREGR